MTGPSDADPHAPRRSAGALAGLRVVDLSRVLGGPFSTQILGDHGADVIKVEPPEGDETRGYGPPFGPNYSAYFGGLNRNKQSIAIDLRTEAGRNLLKRLLADADILVENFKTGTMEKWGLSYERDLRAQFPRLIYCKVRGFGDNGPLGGFPGYDAMVQAWSGLFSINGEQHADPTRIGVPIVDLTTGLNAAIGILLALEERHRSGRGQLVEVALFDSAVALLHPHAANWFMSGQPPKRMGNAHVSIAPYDLFRTATHFVLIGAANNRQFEKLCEILQQPDLGVDPRFATNAERVANRPVLCEALSNVLSGVDGMALADQLMKAGVPAGVVLGIPEVLTHPHTAHREMVVAVGEYRGLGVPVKLGDTPGSIRSTPKAFGSDTDSVLRQIGLTPEEIEDLVARGAVRRAQR